MRLAVIAVVAGLALSPAAAQMGGGGKKNDAVRQQVEKLNRAFEQAAQKKDTKALAQMYTSDARVMGAGSPAAVGREAIEKAWRGFFDAGFADLKIQTETVERHGDVIVELGRYTATFGGKPDDGKYVVIWKKEGGQWKLWIDSFSSDLAPPGA